LQVGTEVAADQPARKPTMPEGTTRTAILGRSLSLVSTRLDQLSGGGEELGGGEFGVEGVSGD
jgi:hypothetical protein